MYELEVGEFVENLESLCSVKQRSRKRMEMPPAKWRMLWFVPRKRDRNWIRG